MKLRHKEILLSYKRIFRKTLLSFHLPIMLEIELKMHIQCRDFFLNFGKTSQIANQVRYVALMLYKLQLNQSQIFGPSYFDSALGNIQYTVSYI